MCQYQLFTDGFCLQSDTSWISGSDTELMQGSYHIKKYYWGVCDYNLSVVTLINDVAWTDYNACKNKNSMSSYCKNHSFCVCVLIPF